MERESNGLTSVQRLFDIVEKILEMESTGVTELSESLDMPKSTVHSHLKTLENEEYVVNENGDYQLGLRFFELGIRSRTRRTIVELVQPSLRQLSRETGEFVWFVVEEYGWAVYVDSEAGEQAIDVGGSLGKRDHLHYLAAGKAILSQLPENRVQEIIQTRGLPQQTNETITDFDNLFAQLGEIRERNGVAFNDNEEVPGLRAVGAPIVHDDTVYGAISISGPTNRMRGARYREDLPDLILGATNEIELRLMNEDIP